MSKGDLLGYTWLDKDGMWVGTKECINEASELRMMQLGGVCREEEGSLLQAGDSPACQESEEDREAVLTELRTW